MSLPKKGLRKITIGENRYAWKVTGNDGWLDLYVVSVDVKNGQLLNAKFHYHHKPKVFAEGKNSQFKISSGIVKQVIHLALNEGWKPLEQKPIINLGHVDNRIKLFGN